MLPSFIIVIGIFFASVYFANAAQKPRETRLPTLNGMPLAGPANSDCQLYAYTNGIAAINCPVSFFPITKAHIVLPNEWGGVLVASGGGTVAITLPATTTLGRNAIGFATDGKTGFTLSTLAPATMQGSAMIVNGMITAPPNSSGWAGLSGTVYQVDLR